MVAPTSVDPRPAWQETGIHGLQRPREWDATVTADAPEVEGDAVRFVTLPDGTVLVEGGAGAAPGAARGGRGPHGGAAVPRPRRAAGREPLDAAGPADRG